MSGLNEKNVESKKGIKTKVASKAGNKCCLPHCGKSKRSSSDVKLFRFPYLDSPLFEEWLKKCNFDKQFVERAPLLFLCDSHFAADCIGKKYLKKGAVPSLYLTDSAKAESIDENNCSGNEDNNLLRTPSPATNIMEEDNLTNNHWIYWCRLCAKEDSKSNIHFLYQTDGEHSKFGNKKLNIQEALAKYFWVQTSLEDSLPKMLCVDCFSLASSLITFNERVQRVQLMFLHLKDACTATSGCDLNSVRLRYDVSEQERDQWFSNYSCTKVHSVDSKSLLIERPESVQTTNETDKQFEVQIKEENGVKSQPLDQEFFTDDDADPEREEVLCDNNLNDSFKEGEEDPFNPKEKHKEMHFDTNCTISEEKTPTKLLQADDESFILKHSDQEFFTDDDTDVEIEVLCEDNSNDSFQEDEKDPFNPKGEDKDMHFDTNCTISDKETPTGVQCEVCKKKFKYKSRLKKHMDIHSPNKHICTICGLLLNSRATLNSHLSVHSDDMPHKCDYCGKAFKHTRTLKHHLLLHTGLRPYSCGFCERTFTNNSNCRTHMKHIHPDEFAILEASGYKAHAKNIPKLKTLKSVIKAGENLIPVGTGGRIAFGKKPKNLENNEVK